MAQNYSPKIITDGLVMCLDPSQNKSYPTTDLPIKDGLNLWLDAADDTTFSYSSGTTVSQWRDKSGQNNHAIVMGGSPLRSVAINSRKAVSFTSTTSFKCVTGAFISTATHIVVCRATTSSATYQRVYNGGANTDHYVFIGALANNIATFWGNGSSWNDINANSPSITILNTLRIISAVNTGAGATPYYDGTAMTVKATNPAAYTGYELNTYATGNLQPLVGEVCEIIVFNKQLSTTELKQVHTYLGQKWGISNTDRQIFDLSGNNFNFSFNGANPRYNAKTIVSNFNTTSPYAVSSFGGQNLTNTILNLLYVDHTIEVAVNLKGFKAVKSFDNPRDYEGAAGIVLWQGYHGGLYVDAATQKLTYLIWNSDPTNVYIEYALPNDLKDKILYITAKRQANVLSIFINGVLVAGPANITTTVRSYTQINIGAAFQGDPSSGGSLGAFVWAGQHEYHLLRMYNKALSASEIVSNYQAFKARFDNNIVRFGLILDLDAGNPTSYAGAGTTWYDVSGNNKIGTLTGGVTYSSIYGGDFILDGVNGYIQTDLNQNTDNAQITWEAWFWDNSPGGFVSNTSIISNYGPNATTPFTILHIFDNGIPLFGQRNSSGTQDEIYGLTSICNSIWHHVVGVVDNSNMLIYVDGVLQQTKTKITGTTTSGQNLVIGGNHLGRYQSCRIASARCYNTALSAAQVLQNYNATKGRFGL